MTRSRHARLARRGFTLVELMVATALVVLILTILAVAFGAATESLSRLRSMGNMATDLRGAQDKLRSDLEADHFITDDSPGTLRLSDLNYNLLPGDTSVRTPLGGFFRIESGTGSIYEGADADGVSSTRATTHVIDFTAKRQGTSPDDLYVVPVNVGSPLLAYNVTDTPLTGNQFVSKWARVRWFLANGQNVAGVTVFTLYRGVRVVAPANVAVGGDELNQVAQTGGTSRTMAELTNPVNRPPFTQYVAGSTYQGDDIVLSNVTSFEVKPTWHGPNSPVGPPRSPRLNWPIANNAFGTNIPDGIPGVGASTPNGDYPFDDLPTGGAGRTFDTWNDVNTLPLRIRVTALQVKIRVFDPKTLLTRQVSFIVQP